MHGLINLEHSVISNYVMNIERHVKASYEMLFTGYDEDEND